MKITITITDEPNGCVGMQVQGEPAITSATEITPAIQLASRMVRHGESFLANIRTEEPETH